MMNSNLEKQYKNQEVLIMCSDGRKITGKVISVGDEGSSMEFLTSDGDRIEIHESEIGAIWIIPKKDTYTPARLLGGPMLIAGFQKDKISKRMWNVRLATPMKGPFLFTFDRKKIYNFWPDYPQNLKPEEIKIFEEDCPYWANCSKERKKKAQEMLKRV